jgi:hypothetical protein
MAKAKETLANQPPDTILDDDSRAVESDEVGGKKSGSFLRDLVCRMSPSQCLASTADISCHNPLFDDEDNPAYDRILPKLLKDLASDGKPRNQALHRLYRLTDRERQVNRYVSMRDDNDGDEDLRGR